MRSRRMAVLVLLLAVADQRVDPLRAVRDEGVDPVEGLTFLVTRWERQLDDPSLATRVQDVPRIITEYAQDAIAVLGTPAGSFEPHDHRWVLEHAATSFDEIEKATLRCVALLSSMNTSRAAAALGMARFSLSKWLARRNRRA